MGNRTNYLIFQFIAKVIFIYFFKHPLRCENNSWSGIVYRCLYFECIILRNHSFVNFKLNKWLFVPENINFVMWLSYLLYHIFCSSRSCIHPSLQLRGFDAIIQAVRIKNESLNFLSELYLPVFERYWLTILIYTTVTIGAMNFLLKYDILSYLSLLKTETIQMEYSPEMHHWKIF